MLLKIERSQRVSFFGRRIYQLHFRAEASEREHNLIKDHKIARRHLYTSFEALYFAEQSRVAADLSREAAKFKLFQSLEQDIKDVGRSYAHGWESFTLALKSAGAPHLTIVHVLNGHMLESPVASELLDVEASLQGAIDELDRFLAALSGFDEETETLLEPSVQDATTGTPPEIWAMRRLIRN